jgi:EmrB/QacA subfamily drug resistance transporter
MSMDTITTEEHRTHHQVTFGILATGVLAYALLQSLVTPVLSTLQHELHTSQDTVTWVLTAYLLSASVFTPIMGRIGDKLGKERIFVVTLAALAIGSLLAAIAPNIGVMIVARVIQGVGGGVLPLAFGIIRDEFPEAKISGAVGIVAALAAVGAGLGLAIAGPIIDVLNYHWLFWIPMILVVVTGIAAHRFIPESPVRSAGKISIAPGVFLSAWLVALLVALSEAPAWGWGSDRVVGLLVAAVVLGVAWVVIEQRSSSPLIDMNMMRRPAVWTTNAVALLVGVGMYATFAFLPEFLQTPPTAGYGFGASVTRSGLVLLPASVTMFVASLAVARLTRWVGAKAVIVIGSATVAVALAMMAVAHGSEWDFVIANAIMGVGIGFAFSAMSAVIVAAVPPEQTGVASGMNANIRTIGGSVGSALMASLVTATVRPDGLPAASGYTRGFAVLAAALVLAALVGLLIPAVTRHTPGLLHEDPDILGHPELGMVAGGTLVGDEDE